VLHSVVAGTDDSVIAAATVAAAMSSSKSKLGADKPKDDKADAKMKDSERRELEELRSMRPVCVSLVT